MPRKKGYPLLYIEWLDHWASDEGGWLPGDTYRTAPIICKNVGWKIGEDKHGILLTSVLHAPGTDEELYRHFTYVLKKVIAKKLVLKNG